MEEIDWSFRMQEIAFSELEGLLRVPCSFLPTTALSPLVRLLLQTKPGAADANAI